MTDREKSQWSGWLIGMWLFPVAVLASSSFGQWVTDEQMVTGFAQLGQGLIFATGSWTLTLAFRVVYLKGKRKGNG